MLGLNEPLVCMVSSEDGGPYPALDKTCTVT